MLFAAGAFGSRTSAKLACGCVSIICLFVFASIPMIEKGTGSDATNGVGSLQRRTWSTLIQSPVKGLSSSKIIQVKCVQRRS